MLALVVDYGLECDMPSIRYSLFVRNCNFNFFLNKLSTSIVNEAPKFYFSETSDTGNKQPTRQQFVFASVNFARQQFMATSVITFCTTAQGHCIACLSNNLLAGHAIKREQGFKFAKPKHFQVKHKSSAEINPTIVLKSFQPNSPLVTPFILQRIIFMFIGSLLQ